MLIGFTGESGSETLMLAFNSDSKRYDTVDVLVINCALKCNHTNEINDN